MVAELAFPAANVVGESLVWDEVSRRLFWVDIVGKAIHALDPVTRRHDHWQTPEFVTSIGLRKGGGAVVGLTKTLCLWDYCSAFQPFAEVEPDQPANRLNEGVVGPDGAFWVGTMQNNIAPNGEPIDMTENTGRLYRCFADGKVEPLVEDRFGITNTLVWTKDGHLVTADTLKNEIYRYKLDLDRGHLAGRKTILRGFNRGLPDGSTMDSQGYIWNCRVVGGGCVVRFDPNGEIDRVVNLPCSWPTSCTFGGRDLGTLFVTSARFTMDEKHLQTHPQEGGLFAVDADVQGLPAHRFG